MQRSISFTIVKLRTDSKKAMEQGSNALNLIYCFREIVKIYRKFNEFDKKL